ncbi:hypothetical protein WL1483_4033 [Aeromonas schubertii]|uniref:Uncharacterized protein n=1 Tax=Aeromonas schubertii TaxID=652 RepID=A0A0S2SP44_9GAMM|nr:hypothetical protein WL1483_4033 [Aeromonas schubertii]
MGGKRIVFEFTGQFTIVLSQLGDLRVQGLKR